MKSTMCRYIGESAWPVTPSKDSFTLCMLGNFSRLFGGLLTFFQNSLFQKNAFKTLSEFQTVWIQIRSDVILGLIWV